MSEPEKPGRKQGRRSERRDLALPIRVYGITLQGREFAEDCVCVKVSRHGAQIRLKHLLIPDDLIRIVNPRKNKEASFRVVEQFSKPPEASYCDWGIEALDPNEDIWDL